MPQKELSLKKSTESIVDWQLLLSTIFLVAAGLISLYSATYESKISSYFWKQLISVEIGFSLMTVTFFTPKSLLKSVALPIYLLSLVLLIAVLLFGVEINSTRGWLRIVGFSIQPAETAKFGVILGIAWHLSAKGRNIGNLRDLMLVVVMAILPAILIFRQPDFGSASVVLVVLIGLLFWSGFDTFILYILFFTPLIAIIALKGDWYFYILVGIVSVAAFAFRKKIFYTLIGIAILLGVGFSSQIAYNYLKDYQKSRIDNFLNPGQDILGTGYNVYQSKMAVGSGGLTGKGFLQGTQTQLRYIPMQWTDFIYSVPTEEFGFIGGSLIVIAFSVLIWRAVKIASETQSKFFSLLAAGIATMILYHATINIGMAIGIMPVTGIPLPFMSAGGSSIIVNLVLIGLLLNIYKDYQLSRSIYK